jgi:hypothetical protein
MLQILNSTWSTLKQSQKMSWLFPKQVRDKISGFSGVGIVIMINKPNELKTVA